jgi:uncharacterized protein YcbX
MIQIQDLYIYPIKSLGGYRVEEAEVTPRGLAHDRRWMLIDQNHRFLTQREHPTMALLKVRPAEKGFRITDQNHPDQMLEIPWTCTGEALEVEIWGDRCQAVTLSAEADAWFTQALGSPCRLVYMPESSRRQVDLNYAPEGTITGFTDGYPILMISQASLDDLNARLSVSVPMNRFRPNLVIAGAEAYAEDRMDSFDINGIAFRGVKPCARCVMTTIDQETGTAGKDPLRTLASYRQNGNKVLFGQNVLGQGSVVLKVGDPVSVSLWRDILLKA